MKKTLLFHLFFLAITVVTIAQKAPKVSDIKFDSNTNYAEYESLALQCADFILQNNYETNSSNIDNLNAFLFMINWMTGTPDYSFTIEDKITKICKKQSLLSSVYMAASLKYAIEHKNDKPSANDINYNGILIFIQYCENPENGVIIKGEMKKLITAKNENKLKEYLKIK
ncbi:MAG: hypothetical protein H6Q25_1060 [Bacteroidetes bacterium]|nr:hypothetical protein [Bacteroidota bacterium]